MFSRQKIIVFQKHILDWYHENQRPLPWRKTRDPYCILISEVMSQQTQLSRVIPKYEAWIKKFSTVQSLAKAKVSEVLAYWSGLGYNRRALNLQKAAQKIAQEYKGAFPRTEKELIALPGIGKYTARAILCFAFDQQVAVVDTNVKKVILTQLIKNSNAEARNPKQIRNNNCQRTKHVEFGILKNSEIISNFGFRILDLPKNDETERTDLSDKEINEIAQQLLPADKAYEWNQALMDYAATVLKKEKIPIPKQSKFHGSHRYYRGQVLKVLLQKKKILVKGLGPLIKKDYTDSEEEWLQQLIDELVHEGFVKYEKTIITLAS